MRYKKLGKSGLDISVIGHGTWSFGNDVFGAVEEKSCIDAIHASLDAGVNLIDMGQTGRRKKLWARRFQIEEKRSF